MLGCWPWRALILMLTSFADRQVPGVAQQLCCGGLIWLAAVSLLLLSLALFIFSILIGCVSCA